MRRQAVPMSSSRKTATAALCAMMALTGMVGVAGVGSVHDDVSSAPSTDSISVSMPLGGSLRLSTGYLPESRISEMKAAIGVREPGRNYNVLIGQNGTGLAPPTAEEWAEMESVPVVCGLAAPAAALAPSVDISKDPRFPKVGNQLNLGSCGAWAETYYAYGYQEAVDNNWTRASLGDPEQLMSPLWTYTMNNGGGDFGSWWGGPSQILIDWGACVMADMPYNASDPVTWGSEEAFRDAPLHRASSYYYIDYAGDETVELAKAMVSGGMPLNIGIQAYEYDWSDGNFILTAEEYEDLDPNHGNTIVGYNDSIEDDGEVGAFRVVNSWGAGFADRGYFWLTYDAFRKMGTNGVLHLSFTQDIPDYEPEMLATWRFSAPPVRDSLITVGIGDPASSHIKPSWTVRNYAEGEGIYPEFMAIDVTELADEYDAGDESFYLSFELTSVQGTLSSFKVENYEYGYSEGLPSSVSAESADVPVNNPFTAHCTFPKVQNLDAGTRHHTIQEANELASPGDRIFIPAATYYEHVVIDRRLDLAGEDCDITVVDGRGASSVITIAADTVNVTGLEIRGSGALPGDAGLNIAGASGCTVTGNEIRCNGCGIITNGSGSMIFRNVITDNVCQAIEGGANEWDAGYPMGGNYWSPVNQVVNETYVAAGGEIGFYLQNNQVDPTFDRVVSVPLLRYVWEDDWSTLYVMQEGSDFTVNNNTGWIELLTGEMWLGDRYYVDYFYNETLIDGFCGPEQDLLGSDGISDGPHCLKTSPGVDHFPLCMEMVDGRISRPPIRINSDADFDMAHGVFSGNGTPESPWVIEGLDLDGVDQGFGMFIGNTTEHFVIRDCDMHRARLLGPDWTETMYMYTYSCLIMLNVTDGSVDSCMMTGAENYGLILVDCRGISASNCTIRRNWEGALLEGCEGCTFKDNLVDLNMEAGVYMAATTSSVLEGNTVRENDYGIYLEGSGGNCLEGNRCNGSVVYDGIMLAEGSDCNTVSGNTCSGNNAHGISVSSCSQNEIAANGCTGNGNYGIYLSGTESSRLEGNALSANFGGLAICDSAGTIIRDSIVCNNTRRGIYLENSTHCTLEGNVMSLNGITIDGTTLESWNTHEIPANNTANGRPIVYLNGASGGTVPAEASQVLLAGCTGTEVLGNDLSWVDIGLSAGFSTGIVASGVTACNNSDSGIFLRNCTGCTLADNTAAGNLYDGIRLSGSDNNTLEENACTQNNCGIRLESSDFNAIAANRVSDNCEKALKQPVAATVESGASGAAPPISVRRMPGLSAGPEAPPQVREGPISAEAMDYSVLIPGVPAYTWYCGCLPTAQTMLMGYWDGQGFEKLVPGNASTMTLAVMDTIASPGSYNEYCMPWDDWPTLMPDRSELPKGDQHPNDCLADFSMTSRSYYQNYFGWGQLRHSLFGVAGYVNHVAPEYRMTITEHYWGDLTWESYCAEIDAGRPVLMNVDSDGDGHMDHAIVATGYGEMSGTRMYNCLTTWDIHQEHWFEFTGISPGQPFGINYADFMTLERGGIGISLVSSGCNHLFHNSIENNSVQADDRGNNTWDAGYPSGGNYWYDIRDAAAFVQVNDEVYTAKGDERGFFLGNNCSDRHFKQVVSIESLRYVWEGNWTSAWEMTSDDYYINYTTGWITIRWWSQFTPGESYCVNYTYERYVGALPVDAFSGIQQDIPGADGIADDPKSLGSVVDHYPLAAPFEYSRCTITLEAGWNLISVPFILDETDPGRALSAIAGKWDVIKTYDPTSANPWKTYHGYGSEIGNSFTALDVGRGYWIHMTEPATLQLKGAEPVIADQIMLHAGWNLVGYPTTCGNVTVAMAFWGTGATMVEVCDRSDPYLVSPVGGSYALRPGEGYWVCVPADSVWVVNW